MGFTMTGAHIYMLAEKRVNTALAEYDFLSGQEREKIGRAAFEEKLWRCEYRLERIAISGFPWLLLFVLFFHFSEVIK